MIFPHPFNKAQIMYKIFFFLSAAAAAAAPTLPPARPDFSRQPQIAVQNGIVSKINGQTYSMMDVKKKMDLFFYQHYPQLADSPQARLQFYETSWRTVLSQMIDNELILADAVDKELKLTDGEIREEMERRFGPNVTQALDKMGLTYEETWKLVKNEMIVQRMTWWFVHSKAIQSVTPQDIRQAYRLYLQENPSYLEWKYRVVSIRADKPDEALSEKVYRFLSESGKSPEAESERLKEFESPGLSIQVSNEYTATDKELSETHRASLASLQPGTYSKPSFQLSRSDKKEKKTVYRIFYLLEKTDHPTLPFEAMAQKLRDDLVQKASAEQSEAYLGKLRKHYGFDAAQLKQTLPDDLHPFSLQ